MPQPTDDGKTYTFKIRQDVKFHDGSPLTAADVAASFNKIIFPADGVLSARSSNYLMVDKVEAPDPTTVVFRLKFATSAFLPALADPFNFIYKKAILDKDPRWYEKNILGSGPFKFVDYQVGQSIKGEKNADYYHKGLPHLDGFTGIYADKQAVRVEAIRSDRAAIEFRSMPPAARDELVKALGDKITVQESDWNVASAVTPNHKRKAVRRPARPPGLDPGDRPLARRAGAVEDRDRQDRRRHRLSRLATGGDPARSWNRSPGIWPDIEKSRAEARRLLKEAGAEGLSFELLNRNVDQPFKYVATWLIDEWSKIGLHVTQRVVPTGPWFEAMRNGDFDVVLEAPGHGMVNPLLDVQKALPASVDSENYGNYDDPQEVDLYDKMLRETDPAQQRALMRQFEKFVLDDQAHMIWVLWWHRIVPYRSYVKGFKIAPTHFINQDLAHDLARQIRIREERVKLKKWRWSRHRLGRRSSSSRRRAAEEEPKRGGTLTYMIPADAPPSFDAHREETYATIHSAAPFYSVLIRANPLRSGQDRRSRLRSVHGDAEADR